MKYVVFSSLFVEDVEFDWYFSDGIETTKQLIDVTGMPVMWHTGDQSREASGGHGSGTTTWKFYQGALEKNNRNRKLSELAMDINLSKNNFEIEFEDIWNKLSNWMKNDEIFIDIYIYIYCIYIYCKYKYIFTCLLLLGMNEPLVFSWISRGWLGQHNGRNTSPILRWWIFEVQIWSMFFVLEKDPT